MKRQVGFILGCVLLASWLWWGGDTVPPVLAGLFAPILSTDTNQVRANSSLPAPHQPVVFEQNFFARRDGLAEIELVLAQQEGGDGQNGRFYLELLDDTGNRVAAQDLASQSLAEGQLYTFRFAPQTHSANRQYTLQIGGDEANTISVKGYSLDVYESGGLIEVNGEETAVSDLRFVTRYRLTWGNAATILADLLRREGLFLLVALFFIPLPGCLLLVQIKPAWRWDGAAWWGIAFALGTAFWPLIWLGVTLINGRFSPWLLWLLFGAGWLFVLFSTYRSSLLAPRFSLLASRFSLLAPRSSLLLLLLLLSLSLRLLAVRDLLFPPWVDSTRHALITAVMSTTGQTPANYAPYLPEVTTFPYHFGFHTLSASLMLMTDWPLNQLLLSLGQLINGLIPLTIYAAVWLTTRQRRAALLAAFLVALPFFFPAYYATWGRFTQLTAVFLMPILVAFTWQLCHGGRGWRKLWWLIGVLAAGLFLIHFRVFLFYVPYAAVVWIANKGRNGRYLAAAALLASVLVLPRALTLFTITDPTTAVSATIPGYNQLPVSYVQVGWEQYFLWAAGFLFVWLLVATILDKRWVSFPLALTGWTAVSVLLLSGQKIGLPETALVNLNSLYITLFIPLSMFLGITVHHLLHSRYQPVQLTFNAILGATIATLCLFGLRQQTTILNDQTILAWQEDLDGLLWAQQNLPTDARLAVNSWLWLGAAWAGGDGGAWLLPLAHRASSTPPADYAYHVPSIYAVDELNKALTAVSDWSDPAQAAWLQQQGYTHIYVGAKGGFFDPAALAQNPNLEMIYGRNGVFIFAIAP